MERGVAAIASSPPATPSPPPPRPRVGVGALLLVRGAAGGGDSGAAGVGGGLRVLIGERAGSHGAGRLALPGGHLDYGERSFAACAAREVAEETGLHVAASRFVVAGVTNDVMEAECLHYVTVFCAALVSEEEALGAANLEPHKCKGWALERLSKLAEPALAPRLFSPLAAFLAQLEQGAGERRLRETLAELESLQK